LTRWSAPLNKKFGLPLRRSAACTKSIDAHEADLIAMRKVTYTGLIEQNNDARNVSHGDKGTQFSALTGKTASAQPRHSTSLQSASPKMPDRIFASKVDRWIHKPWRPRNAVGRRRVRGFLRG
jgi:hypothetical protein